MKRAILAATMLILAVAGAAAQEPAGKPPDPAAATEASIHGFGDTDKTCQEWTDGCRTCRRSEAGAPVCPNIGISCQPVAITCARRSEPPKAAPPKPDPPTPDPPKIEPPK